MAEITLGVLPLAVTAFVAYRKVVTFVSSYKSYHQDSQLVIRRVFVLEAVLKVNLDLFLRNLLNKEERGTLLTDLNNPQWWEDELNTRLDIKLGDYAGPVKAAIKNCSLTLDKIHDSQLHAQDRLREEEEVPATPPPAPPPPTHAGVPPPSAATHPAAKDQAVTPQSVASTRKRDRALRSMISFLPCLYPRAEGPQAEHQRPEHTGAERQQAERQQAEHHRAERHRAERLRAEHPSARERFFNLINGFLEELRNLCKELRDYVDDLESLLRAVSQQLGMCDSADEEGVSCPVTSPVSEILATTRRNTEYVHATSVRLHQAISNTLICQCHIVHLCLDGQTAKSPAVVLDPKGKSKQQQKPDDQVLAQFSFLFMHGSGESIKPCSTMVCFRPDGSGGIVTTSPVGGSGSGNICAEVTAERDGYERYLHDPSGSDGGAGGFRLWLEPSLQSKLGLGGSSSSGSTSAHSITGGSTSGSYISLQQVINTCHRELTVHDRLLMTISFARSLLHLYSSSWIRDWGIGTIHFFTAQEVQKAEFGQLTPYLALRQGDNGSDNGICDRNRDVYKLGYLLLQLGCFYIGELQEAAGGAGAELMIQKAISKAYKSMGKNYVGFVKRCLNDWGQNRGLDLMREKHLETYLECLVELREDAKSFEDQPQ